MNAIPQPLIDPWSHKITRRDDGKIVVELVGADGTSPIVLTIELTPPMALALGRGLIAEVGQDASRNEREL